MHQIIYGKHLIQAKRRLDLSDEFVAKIDPEGFNVVMFMMIHNDGPDYRLMVLFKLKDREEPYEGTVTIPGNLLDKLVHSVDVDGQTGKVH